MIAKKGERAPSAPPLNLPLKPILQDEEVLGCFNDLYERFVVVSIGKTFNNVPITNKNTS